MLRTHTTDIAPETSQESPLDALLAKPTRLGQTLDEPNGSFASGPNRPDYVTYDDIKITLGGLTSPGLGFDPWERPQRVPPRAICWCGDPSCPGEEFLRSYGGR